MGLLRKLVEPAGSAGIVAAGAPGTAVIRGMGVPPRGQAAWYKLLLDLEVRPGAGSPYLVADEHMVPADAWLQPGTELVVAIDPADRARVVIDWDRSPGKPPLGVVRPL